RKCDRHVLKNLGIVGAVAQGEAIGSEGRVEVALSLEGERFAQVVEALGFQLALRVAAEEAAPPRHASRRKGCETGAAAGGARRKPGRKAMRWNDDEQRRKSHRRVVVRPRPTTRSASYTVSCRYSLPPISRPH